MNKKLTWICATLPSMLNWVLVEILNDFSYTDEIKFQEEIKD